jgi:hypothetical protein
MMMGVVDAERPAQRRQQVLLIHLCVARHGFVRKSFRHVAEFRDGFLLQILVGNRRCHRCPPGICVSSRCGRKV